MARIDLPDGSDEEVIRALMLSPDLAAGAGSFSHAVYEKSPLPLRLRELVRMRVARANDCEICREARPGADATGTVSETDYAAVTEWRDHPGFSPAERIAIEYAERFAEDHRSLDQAFFDRLAEHYSPAEIVTLTLSIACFLGLGRVNAVLGLTQSCPLEL